MLIELVVSLRREYLNIFRIDVEQLGYHTLAQGAVNRLDYKADTVVGKFLHMLLHLGICGEGHKEQHADFACDREVNYLVVVLVEGGFLLAVRNHDPMWSLLPRSILRLPIQPETPSPLS